MFWNRTAHPKDEDLSAYLDGELRGTALAAMNAHVDDCERCRSLLDELATAKSALASLPRETPRRSFQIAPQLKPAPRRSLIPAWTPAAALTVFLVLVAVDIGSFGGSSDDSATSGGALAGRAANESAGKAADAPSAQGDAFSSGTPVPALAGGATAPAPSADAARQQPNAPPAATQQPATTSQADQGASGDNLGTLRLDDKDGRSLTTLNLLEGVFLALFLGSMLGLYVWPRFLRKGP